MISAVFKSLSHNTMVLCILLYLKTLVFFPSGSSLFCFLSLFSELRPCPETSPNSLSERPLDLRLWLTKCFATIEVHTPASPNNASLRRDTAAAAALLQIACWHSIYVWDAFVAWRSLLQCLTMACGEPPRKCCFTVWSWGNCFSKQNCVQYRRQNRRCCFL